MCASGIKSGELPRLGTHPVQGRTTLFKMDFRRSFYGRRNDYCEPWDPDDFFC
jgi:hypothetical protein